jgi:uncharacterized protein YggE
MTMPTLTTSATARRKQKPDLATIEVAAVGEGETAAVARATASDRGKTIRESVTAVSTDQIQTVDIQVEEVDDVFGPDTDADYHAREELTIECLPESAEDVVLDVTEVSGTVQSVQFGLHPDRHQNLQTEALSTAMDRAREKAEQLAACEAMTIAGVQSISTTEMPTGMEGIVDEVLHDVPETGLSPTPVTVSESVEVVYELAEN